MSELIVIGFDDEKTAFEMRVSLNEMQKMDLLKMEDVVVVTKDDKGRMKLHQSATLTAAGAIWGGFWGMLIGAVVLNPAAGAAIGAGLRALAGKVFDAGIERDFIKDVKHLLESKSAAVFIRLKEIKNEEKVLERVSPYKGEIIKTTLLADEEVKLRQVFEAVE